MRKIIVLLFLSLMLALAGCIVTHEKEADIETQYKMYCGMCHLVPDPSNIPKSFWEDPVLPEMAARLGYKHGSYNPLARNSMEENLYIRLSNAYPKEAIIDSATWKRIYDYVISLAPDSIPVDTLREKRNSPLLQFNPISIPLEENKPAGVTHLQFESGKFVVGYVNGEIHKWPKDSDSVLRFQSPVISYHPKGKDLYITEMGYMNPSEKPLGAIHKISSGKTDTLARKLHRPVFTKISDLNGDGQDEILICEFGNLTGKLSLLVHADSQYEKRTLLAVPGTIKLEIVDMNDDGKKDIVVLASQGNEGIYILYQEDDLAFRQDQVIRMGPEYGSSWFELIDYNKDNHPDIVLVNGDNADYSDFLKPFHGIRLFLNDGKNAFEQKWFYPIYGATRVLGSDYDLDGDIDFAVMSFFPDFLGSGEESFVYLENKTPEQYLFDSQTFSGAKSGRWMVMEKGDIDEDGDIDIMLGSFLLPLNREKFKSTIDIWRKERVDLLFLENKAF